MNCRDRRKKSFIDSAGREKMGKKLKRKKNKNTKEKIRKRNKNVPRLISFVNDNETGNCILWRKITVRSGSTASRHR